MRRIHSIFLVFVLLAAAVAAGVSYLNRVVFPVKARQWAETAASEALGRSVSIDRVRVHVWHGFILDNVTVAEDPRFGKEPLLHVDQVRGGILFLPIFKQRQLIIPTLNIIGPHLRLIQNTDGLWNFRTLSLKPSSPVKRPSFGVLIPRIILSEGRLEVDPARGNPPAHFDFQKVGLELHLSLPAQVEGTAFAELQGMLPTPLRFRGKYRLQERRFELQNNSHWALPVLMSYLPDPIREKIGDLKGTAGMDLEIQGTPRGPMELKAWLETEGFIWEIRQPQPLKATGELQIQLSGKIPSLSEPDLWRKFSGTVHLERVALGPLPTFKELRELTGDLVVDPAGIRTEKLTALLPENVPVEMSGSITADAQRKFGFRVKTAFPLGQRPPLPPAFENFLRVIQPSGEVEAEVVGTGAFLPGWEIHPTATFNFRNVAGTLPKGGNFTDGQGMLRWQPDLLTFSNVSGQWAGRPFLLEGTLVHFDQPEIDARASWGDLSAEAQMEIGSEKIGVELLTGRFPGGTFRVLGEILRPEPMANLFLESSFRAEEIGRLWPPALSAIQENGLKGEVTLRGLLEGNLSKPAELAIDVKASSPQFTVREIPFQSVSVDLKQEKGTTTLNGLQASLAEGILTASGLLRRDGPKQPWDGKLSVSGLNLQELARQLKWKDQEIAGLLNLDWTGSGESNLPETIQGKGRLQIAGGRIFEFPFLGQFADLVRAPALKTIAFREAKGTFETADGKIETKDLQVSSPQATVSIMGWGGFLKGLESPIEWRLVPTFAPELIPEETRSQIGKVLAKGASYFVGEVRISGTWKEPKTKFISKPVTQILNEQLFNLQDLLGDLF